MDDKKSSETSIEEDISAEITTSNLVESSSDKFKIAKLKSKGRELFQSLYNDNEEVNRKFEIDDDELSSGKIAQHFRPKEADEHTEENVTKSKKDKRKTNPVSKKTTEENSLSQNTTNDISEIADEESETDDGQQTKVRSLELSCGENISVEKRGCHSLETVVKIANTQRNEEANKEKHDLVEEIVTSKDLIIISEKDSKSPKSAGGVNDGVTQIDEILSLSKTEDGSVIEEDMTVFKEKVLSMNQSPKSNGCIEPMLPKAIDPLEKNENPVIEKMERVQEFRKEALEDITEESEKISSSHSGVVQNDDTTNDFDSIISLNMIQLLENRVKEIEEIVKDSSTSLNSLNTPLMDASQRRELFANKGEHDSLKDIPPSGRESTSLVTTTSTEYRTIQEELGNKMIDFHFEISQKNTVIEKLTDSLQQSMKIREQLQQQSDQLSLEVQQLRKQLTETLDAIRKPYWPRGDQESSTGGQRLSEISIDLVSESDEDLDRQILTDEEKISTNSTRNSKERQLGEGGIEIYDPAENPTITKQIEQFQKYLNPDELRIFFMVQKKFDDLLCEEIEKARMRFENEIKNLNEHSEVEKHEKDLEINRLRQLLANVKSGSTELIELRQELESIHAHEMGKLRMYFEKKCADLEKQFSEEIFSQKSARDDSINSGSDLSEQENFSEENKNVVSTEGTCRKKTRKELYASPSHRQITPGTDSEQDRDIGVTINDLKKFYREKIYDIKKNYEEIIRRQNERIKQYEARHTDDDFMVLLSETTTDDHHWPPELILLREKFTAKSQLEIAQLQIKHEEEMARLKTDYEKQLNRKFKRNSTFDLSRDLDQIVHEKENLRELSSTFRWILCELAKYVTLNDDDFNASFLEEFNNLVTSQQNSPDKENQGNPNSSAQSNQLLQINTSKRLKCVPNVSGLLTVIDDPDLVEFVTSGQCETSFNLKDCLDKLKSEASYLLELSENLNKRNREDEVGTEKNDSCEEEDGLKSGINRTPKKVARASSFNENVLRRQYHDQKHHSHEERSTVLSLPPNLHNSENPSQFPINEDLSTNLQVNELKNHLMKAENERQKLQEELRATIKRNNELGQELNALREQLDSQKEEYSEGYAIGQIKSPQRVCKPTNSFTQLQEKARNILSTPTKNMTDNSQVLLQMIEEFCREGDKVVDDGKKEKEDLQSQIDAADKQLKSIRQFLDDQATERELERDEFVKEIEKLKNQIKEKEKEKTSFEVASKEMEHMDHQIKELNQQTRELEAKKDKLEIELKASIDKIFVLREIISELETQVETKSLNEHVLGEKNKELEKFIASQTRSNENLQTQIENLKAEISEEYQEKIAHLEDQLKNYRVGGEQSAIWNQITEQLRDIEITLEQKIKNLESLHHSVCSISCSTSPVEDVSVQGQIKRKPTAAAAATAVSPPPQSSPVNISPRSLSSLHSLPTDEVQRVYEKLAKHTRVEEAAIKRIKDLEMQVANIRDNFSELQHERDALQEKMSEQLQRISVLQTKLDEQRHRAEELQRHGTSDLTIRIHDLQNEIHTLKETLSVRDKQIANLKKQLEQSKLLIERQEAELAVGIQSDRSTLNKLETELKARTDENKKLKEKMKTEMINKLALPDLMETMLADKNEEIDHLKEQLESKDKELKGILEINLNQSKSALKEKEDDESNKSSARTLSDIHSISEYDEPEAIRRAAVVNASSLIIPQIPEQILDTSKPTLDAINEVPAIQAFKPRAVSYEAPHYFQQSSFMKDDSSKNAQSPIPRRINFSEFSQDETKIKSGVSKIEEEIVESDEIKILNAKLRAAEEKVESLKISKETIENEKNGEIEQMRVNLVKQTELYESLCQERDQLILQKQDLSEKLETYSKLKSALKEKEGEISDLQNKFSTIEQQLDEVERELEKKSSEFQNLLQENNELNTKTAKLEKEIADLTSNSKEQTKNFEHEIDTLKEVIQEKDEIISKQEKNLFNLRENEKSLLEKITKLEMEIETIRTMPGDDASLQAELNQLKAELSQKMLLYEKCLLDIQAYQKDIEVLKAQNKNKDQIIATGFGSTADSKSLQDAIAGIQQKLQNNENLNEIKNNLHEEQQRNHELEQRNSILANELEKLRSQNAASTSGDSSKPYSVDEIAEQVEKELNYSAQLDSNILRVMIDNEDVNNLNLKTDHEKLMERDLLIQIQMLKNNLETETKQVTAIRQALNEEKKHSQEIQQQDAEIIQALRLRLEDALQKEEEFHKILDEERAKCERLTTQIAVLQRSEARRASMQLKSPPDSPRKQAKEFDFELNERLKTEIKLLTAQNERERERVTDLQRVLEREKIRFETELSDRINYAEKLKKEMEKITHEKGLAENQVEHLEERLSLALKEIESLEVRISALQEAETRRAHRRGKERIENTQNAVELQELKVKAAGLEAERDNLNHTIALLRSDIEKSAQREAKLAEALVNSCGDAAVPQQFAQKLKEMNCLLVENTKENRQMTETLQYLTEERKALQKKIEELEMLNQNSAVTARNLMEMEERANHLFGRYLRVESHRKALVHQKRYLLIVLQTYQENEMKTLALLNVNVPSKPKKKLFKSVALAIIAIQRMKFIVRRWQTGKRTVAKSIFHFQAQKRSTLPLVNSGQPTSSSPPCRDKFATMNSRLNYFDNPFKPLNTPGLISDFPVQKTDWIQWKK